MSQQPVSADIIQNSAVLCGSPLQGLPEYSTWYSSTLQPLLENETEVAEKSSWDQKQRGETWFGLEKLERKLAKLSMTTFAYRSSSYLFYAVTPHKKN